MVLRMKETLTIDNLRHYPAETVDELRGLLRAGASAEPDPHRANFYQLQGASHAFYIHVAPPEGKILLLAVWPRAPVATA